MFVILRTANKVKNKQSWKFKFLEQDALNVSHWKKLPVRQWHKQVLMQLFRKWKILWKSCNLV